jgi:hypothetical protein
MKIKLLTIYIIIFSFLLSGCAASNSKQSMGQIYTLALEGFMPKDEALNSNMKYIAIDMSNFKDVDDKDKKEILNYFKKYNVETMDSTYEQLKEKGLWNAKTKALDGILLRVESTEVVRNKVIIKASKYRSGLGAIGGESTVIYKNGSWILKEAKDTWIS